MATCLSQAEDIETIELKPGKHMIRADLHVLKVVKEPKAVLVLSPGYNGNGIHWIRRQQWQDFARDNDLALVGLSFASDQKKIPAGTGYYHASQESGELLLDGIRQAFGKNLPLLLYGYSGGAHFTSRFVEWKPERVISWCAYSAGWWDEPQPADVTPMGIVACGEEDPRLGASLIYFKQGRAAGKPWLWVGIPGNGHTPERRVEQFIREYFHEVLIQKNSKGLWVDIDSGEVISEKRALLEPSLSGWLPNVKLKVGWFSLLR